MVESIQYTRASVLSDGTFEFMGRNPTKMAGDDDDKEQAARALRGLNELQQREKGSISAVSLSCGLQYLREQAALTNVFLVGPECDLFADDEEAEDFRRVRRALRSADWLLWVVGTGDHHYVVVVWHLDPLPTEEAGAKEQKKKKKRARRQVREWAVVDPTGDDGAATRTRRVTDRLQALASTPRLRVDGFAPGSERGVAAAGVPGEAWSSGLRAFGVVDTVLQRLAARAFGAAAAAAAVWAPMPPHFNGVRARNDMMTACAHQARRATGWGLRLALASVRAGPKGGKEGGAAPEQRFEPSEAGSPVGPLTPVSPGPSSRASSRPPAPSKKRKTYRVPRIPSDEDEAEPAPKRRKTSSTRAGGPVGSSVAKKSRAFVASAACTASPTASDGLIETNQALGDDPTPCGTEKPTLPEPTVPAVNDQAMVDAASLLHVSTEEERANISHTVPESMAPTVNEPANINSQAMGDAPSTLQDSPVDGEENANISQPVPESPFSEEEEALWEWRRER